MRGMLAQAGVLPPDAGTPPRHTGGMGRDLETTVAGLLSVGRRATGVAAEVIRTRRPAVITAKGDEIRAGAVVLTTGTFLNGLIHIGETKIPAGRMKVQEGVEPPSIGLSRTLYGFGR